MHHWNSTSDATSAVATTTAHPPPICPPLSKHLVIGRASPGDGGFACCRYVLFMQTTQRLTRARRLPALKVSDWGFLNISD